MGGKYAIVHFRGAYLGVDLADMRSANRLLEVLGRDGEFRLHLSSTEPPIHYLVDFQALIFLAKMRNEIPNRNQTTLANTGAMASRRAFYEPTHNQKIDIRDLGWVGAFNEFVGHLGNLQELKNEEGMKDTVTESKSLTRGHRIESNSVGNSEIPGSLAGGIAKTLIYGEAKKPDADLKIGIIKRAIIDFAKQVKTKRTGRKQYKGCNFGNWEIGNSWK